MTREARVSLDDAVWWLTRRYASWTGWVRRATGRHVKGTGFLLRRLSTDREFTSNGFRWYLDHRLGGTYARLLSGSFNEPETQSFLQFVAGGLDEPVMFVNVGANIGEMVIPMAAHPSVAKVVAFEPHDVCNRVLQQNLRLNGLARTDVHRVVVGDGSPQRYVQHATDAPMSGIQPERIDVEPMPTVRLDDILNCSGPVVMLVDVEGAELDVIRGASKFIESCRPLIVFEYHRGTRERFSLNQVMETLGDDYAILRLRGDGFLDRVLEDTWNCVAYHAGSVFATACAQRTLD